MILIEKRSSLKTGIIPPPRGKRRRTKDYDCSEHPARLQVAQGVVIVLHPFISSYFRISSNSFVRGSLAL